MEKHSLETSIRRKAKRLTLRAQKGRRDWLWYVVDPNHGTNLMLEMSALRADAWLNDFAGRK